jgi:hypothetical protein
LTGALATELFDGRPVVPAAEYFGKTVGAVVNTELARGGYSRDEQLAMNGFRLRPAAPGGQPRPYAPESFTALKAGPLLGVWATGPYLHNGSVPTIYDLLSSPAERPAAFWVGGIELDPVKLGFMSGEGAAPFRFDTTLPGNGNGGHAYPATPLSHEEKLAVIEYLKDPMALAADR